MSDRAHGDAASMLPAARAIDEQLFRPASWLMLDESNQVVPGVRPGTLDAAVELCGRGSITSFFGRLRPGVVAVDVDMVRATGPVMALVAWCVERRLWHLVRQSGRRGHAHVFIVVGDRGDELESFASELRVAEGVSRTCIDVRTSIRPLVAPHRSEATPPLPKLGRLARGLPRALAGLPPSTTTTGPPARHKARSPHLGVLPEVPPPRKHRGLPMAWDQYLRSGIRPPQVSTWADRSRSAVESCATFHMVMAGWSVTQSWLAISTSHPAAFGKARERGQEWWKAHVWNRAVASAAQDSTPERSGRTEGTRRPESDPEVALSVREWQRAFCAVWTSYGRDRRHTLRFLLDTLADRMVRTGSTTVPCPERDLVLDTGIASRQTIREALHQLADDGWLVLHTTFDPASAEAGSRSHHVSLPARRSYPTPLPEPFPPSSFTPPLPQRLRATLGPRLSHLYTALPPDNPAHPADLAAPSGAASPGTPPSTKHLRTMRAGLHHLASVGLAAVDETGRWRSLPPDNVTPDLVGAAERHYAERAEAVAAERAEYELVRQKRGRWEKQREALLVRNRVAAYLGSRRWWEELPESERRVRQGAYESRFARMTLAEKAATKERLARERAQAGVASEESVRREWIEGLPPDVYCTRVIERTMRYRELPPPLQAAYASAWAAHRSRWGIERDRFVPPQVMAAGVEQAEQLALLDALERDPQGRLAGVFATPGGETDSVESRAGQPQAG